LLLIHGEEIASAAIASDLKIMSKVNTTKKNRSKWFIQRKNHIKKIIITRQPKKKKKKKKTKPIFLLHLIRVAVSGPMASSSA
jgi:hypothetical protein